MIINQITHSKKIEKHLCHCCGKEKRVWMTEDFDSPIENRYTIIDHKNCEHYEVERHYEKWVSMCLNQNCQLHGEVFDTMMYTPEIIMSFDDSLFK